MPTRESTIKEHKRDGKRLIPPLMQLPMKPRSWMNDALPDMLWAILLISELKRDEALNIFRKTADNLAEYVLKNPTEDINVTHSGLAILKPDVLENILSDIGKNENARNALKPLLLYKDLPAYDIWEKLVAKKPENEDWEKLAKAVHKTLFHQSQESTDCRWVKVYFMYATNRVTVVARLAHLRDEVMGYPNVGDMAKVRASIRAGEIGIDMTAMKGKSIWPQTFWDKSLELTKCIPSQPEDTKKDEENEELKKRMNDWFFYLMKKYGEYLTTTKVAPKKDSIFGIAFYSWRLTLETVIAQISFFVSGRLALRALVESYIVLSYLLKEDDEKQWATYRQYGTGQAKLAELKFEELGYPDMVDKDLIHNIANEDAWVEFVPIDLGNWGGKDLRMMSEETGTKTEYDKYYVWTSGFSHANWGAVREAVLETCGNPLHRLHRIPIVNDKLLPDLKNDALDIFERIIKLVEQTYPTKSEKEESKNTSAQNPKK